MANHEHIRESCPSCGGNEIKADWRYGKKLKRNEIFRLAFRDPIFWIGLALVSLPAWFAGYTGQTWRYGLEALGFVLVLISTVRVYRAGKSPGVASQFPETKYSCLLCGHQWTSAEPRTVVAQGTVDPETADKVEPQSAKTDVQTESKEKSQAGQDLLKRPGSKRIMDMILISLVVILGCTFICLIGYTLQYRDCDKRHTWPHPAVDVSPLLSLAIPEDMDISQSEKTRNSEYDVSIDTEYYATRAAADRKFESLAQGSIIGSSPNRYYLGEIKEYPGDFCMGSGFFTSSIIIQKGRNIITIHEYAHVKNSPGIDIAIKELADNLSKALQSRKIIGHQGSLNISVNTWEDSNKDGIRQFDEKPLFRVIICQEQSQPAAGDKICKPTKMLGGIAYVPIFLPPQSKSSRVHYSIYPEIPAGYLLTTDQQCEVVCDWEKCAPAAGCSFGFAPAK